MTDLAFPPIRKSIRIAAPADHAFTVFTVQIAHWWPAASHSVSRIEGTRIVFPDAAGGEIAEITASGIRHVWGTVLTHERPTRLLFTWHPGRTADEAGEVEVTFAATADGCEVTLEHRGWDRRGADAARAHKSYDAGWALVFGEHFRAAAGPMPLSDRHRA